MTLLSANKIKLMLTALAFSIPLGSATAAPACGTYEEISSALASKYKERPMHRGITPQGTMVEVFTSQNGTFTVVVTLPTGQSCLVSAGTHWGPAIQSADDEEPRTLLQ